MEKPDSNAAGNASLSQAMAATTGADRTNEELAAGKAVLQNAASGVDELIQAGGAFLEAANLKEAEEAFQRVLALEPDNFVAFASLGDVYASTERIIAAIDSYLKALEQRPDSTRAHFNVAVLLDRSMQYAKAEEHYRIVLKREPAATPAMSNLARCLLRQKRFKEADATLSALMAQGGARAFDYYHLGEVMQSLGKYPSAEKAFRTAITINPADEDLHERLYDYLLEARRYDEALSVAGEWGENHPDSTSASHAAKRLDAQAELTQPPSTTRIQHEFRADVATSFNALSNRNEYKGPQFVEAAVQAMFPAANKSLDILDAGCGTGLCGAKLRPYARSLIGVDLAPAMLEQARETGSYDQLAEDELSVYLERSPHSFDVIVAVDSLVYFYGLERVCAALATALRPDGKLILTLELLANPRTGQNAGFSPRSRHAHSAAYVTHCLTAAGFEIGDRQEAVLRQERDRPVTAQCLVARRIEIAAEETGDETETETD